jgi:Reverse transcriptase (RNA-dependent DNA polymerase)
VQEEVGDKPIILPSRFVLAIKKKDGEEVLKAIFELGSHRDRDKRKLVHSCSTLKQSSVRLLTSTAAIMGCEVISADVTQTHLQSASELKRKVFVKPNCIDPKPDELHQIMKSLYGLAKSGDYCAQMFVRHHLTNLWMAQATGVFSSFFKRARGALIGMSGFYVDDVIRAGTPEFLASETRNTEAAFDTKAPAKGNFEFLGLRTSEANSVRTLSQAEYESHIKLLPAMADHSAHRSLRAQIAWVTHTRPDIACAVSQAAKVTQETFDSRSISDLNRIIKYLRQTSEVSLNFAPLELLSLRMFINTDASQANNEDLSSQVGYIIVLTDNTNCASILHCQSHKSQRVKI